MFISILFNIYFNILKYIAGQGGHSQIQLVTPLHHFISLTFDSSVQKSMGIFHFYVPFRHTE